MICECGQRMKCIDSRPADQRGTRRRYTCRCGVRLTTLEVVADTASDGRASLGEMRGNAILRNIVAICQDAIAENERIA